VTIRDIMILLGFDVDEQSQNEAENSVKNLKNMATKALGAIGVAFSVAGAASFIKDCVSVASEVEEMQNKFDVVFQGMTDEVEAWAQSYSDAIGRNKNDIKTYLADQQNLLVGFGMTRQEGAELSKQMTTLALDLASFANLDETAAVNNMTKAVMGESEAAKALGAVLNDDTRARAMQAMGLSGTYEKLDQLTKMQVNYNAILAQSPDAIGDCERSLGSYKSTVVQFQSKLKEIKTLVGQFFMPTFQKVISFGAKGLTVLRDGVQKLNDFASKIGGAEKIIGVLGVTIGATLAIVNFQKISNGLKLIGKGLSNVNLKVFAIAAVVLMLALIVQDFIAFMNGDNSVIGALFEKAGIDADEARATIQKAWSTIKDFLLSIWGTLQGAAQAIFGALSDWWAENGEAVKETLLGIWKAIVGAAKQIFGALSGWWKENGAQVMETFSKLWEGIKQLCETLWNALVSAAQTIFGALKVFWDTWGSTIIAVFSILWNTLISLIQPFLDYLSALIDFLANVFTGNWEGAWNAIKDMAAAAWEMLVTILSGAWDTITTIWGAVIDFFAGIFQGVWDVIVEKVTGIKDAIVNGFQAAIDWITALPEQALKWGSDIVDNIVNGITGAVGKVGEAVKGVADKIKSFLGFSEPEDGPLSDFHTYMPDMIDLMTQGIAAGKERVRSAVEEIAAGMSDGMNLEDNSGSVTGMVGNLLGGIKAAKTKANEMLGSMNDDGMTFNPKIAIESSDLGNCISAGIAAAKGKASDFLGSISGNMPEGIDFDIPDVASMITQGIAAGKEKLNGLLQGFDGGLSFMTQANVVQPETVSKVGGGNDSKSVSITQNVNIDNQFNGDRAGQEKSSEAMDKAADDSTSEMARALQFARG
jgi:phage-related protein